MSHIYNYIIKLRYPLILKSLLVGLLGGFIVIMYRLLLSLITNYTFPLFLKIGGSYTYIIIMFLVLALLGYMVGIIIEKEPMVKGSGIPQVQGVLLGKMKFNWFKTIIFKFIGGLITLGAGLSLGREGPSVQIGAASGMGIAKIFKANKTEEKYLITCGSSAGLAAAFNAPLAGVMFALEEIHKLFSPVILISAMISAISADFLSKYVFGIKPILEFSKVSPLPLSNYPLLIFLGIIVGILGVVFSKGIVKFNKFYTNTFPMKDRFKPIIPFLLTGIIGLTLPILLGGGHDLIISLTTKKYALNFLIMLLVVKLIFSIISYSSSAPGGIFLPMLSIGALCGCIVGTVSSRYLGLDSSFIANFIILAMAGYFSAVVKSPITAIILISEMTGSFNHLLALSIVALISYIVSDALKGKAIYETLLKGMIKPSDTVEIDNDYLEKVIVEVPIKHDSKYNNHFVKELNLPDNTLLVSIRRQGKDIIPSGNSKLLSGDFLLVLTPNLNTNDIIQYFKE